MKTQMSSYEQQAVDFLAKHGITFAAQHIGHDCPGFCEDHAKQKDMDKVNTYPRKSHIHGHHYVVKFTKGTDVIAKGTKVVLFDFWNSYADEEHNALGSKRYRNGETLIRFGIGEPRRTVSAYDVLACLQKNDIGSFENFCGDFGYDSDSRKVEQVYFDVQKEWNKVRQFFTDEELAEMQEIQ